MLKLTTDKHEASRGLSATAELLVQQQLPAFAIASQNPNSVVSVVSVNNFKTRLDKLRTTDKARFEYKVELSGSGIFRNMKFYLLVNLHISIIRREQMPLEAMPTGTRLCLGNDCVPPSTRAPRARSLTVPARARMQLK